MAQAGATRIPGASGESVTKRLTQELMQVMMESDVNATAFPPDESNLFLWHGKVTGAEGTVYEGLQYKLSIEFPENYPYSAPTCKFVTPCFHPNVDGYGNICLDILKEAWSATYSVQSILHSLRSLLSDPNPDSPLNNDAAKLWLSRNFEAYRETLLSKNPEALTKK